MTLRIRTRLAQRRQQVADLHLKGCTQMVIAEQLGICQATVHKDLKHIERQLLESAETNVALEQQRQLRKLDQIEREAWLAYEQSKKPAQSADITGDGEGNQTRKRIRNQHGDPRFLSLINQCVIQRRFLLGLDAPTKIAPTMPDGVTPYTSASLAVIDQLSAEDFKFIQEAHAILAQATGKEVAGCAI